MFAIPWWGGIPPYYIILPYVTMLLRYSQSEPSRSNAPWRSITHLHQALEGLLQQVFLWPSAGTLGTHKNIGTVTCLNCRLNLVIGIRASLKCSAPQKPTMFSKECMFSCQMPSRDHSFLPLFRAGQNGAICHHDIVVCKNASVREFLWHAMAISCSPMIPMHPDATSSPTLSKDQSVQDTPPNLIGPWIPRRWHLRPVEVSHANRPEIGDTGRVGFVVSSARSAIPGHFHHPPFFSISFNF